MKSYLPKVVDSQRSERLLKGIFRENGEYLIIYKTGDEISVEGKGKFAFDMDEINQIMKGESDD